MKYLYKISKAMLGITILLFCLVFIENKPIKIYPEYKNINPELQEYVINYMKLAKENGIVFHGNITMDFGGLSTNEFVGITNFMLFWREIDVNLEFWKNATPITRTTLMFHEFTHAYCGRSHTYGHGIPYKNEESLNNSGPGFYEIDKCPTSIIYPYLLTDVCMVIHFDDYTKEMFNDCKPW